MSLLNGSQPQNEKRKQQQAAFKNTYHTVKKNCQHTQGCFQHATRAHMMHDAAHHARAQHIAAMKTEILKKASWSQDELLSLIGHFNTANHGGWKLGEIKQDIFTGLVITTRLDNHTPTFIFRLKDGRYYCRSFTLV